MEVKSGIFSAFIVSTWDKNNNGTIARSYKPIEVPLWIYP